MSETTRPVHRENPTTQRSDGPPHTSGIVNRRVFEQPVPTVGEVIGGCYRVAGEAGRGAMGVVLLAIDEQLERRVAVKLLHSQLRDDSLRERFLMEARTMAMIDHPNVASVFAFGEHRGVPYFVMEYVEGRTVADWLVESGPQPDILSALRILEDACRGIGAIHAAGAIHRDIKPSNLLLDNEFRTRVADFGLAERALDGSRIHEVAGTVAYMAPEIAFSEGEARANASQLSDVYALGCVAYELLTGTLPFESDTDMGIMLQHATEVPLPVSLVRPELTAAFDRLLMRALEKKPERRTPSVQAFLQELLAARQRFLEPLRILVAEDDDDFRELLGLKLAQEFPGASIECVADGHAAIRAFDADPASVVLLDLQMPNLDGVDVTAVLRTREAATLVPILVITASGGPAEWKLMSALGADRFLVKPVPLDDVVQTIRAAMKERRDAARRQA